MKTQSRWKTEQSATSKSHQVSHQTASSMKVVDRHIINRTHTAVFMLVDHSRDALMQRPYKVLVMMMQLINLKSAITFGGCGMSQPERSKNLYNLANSGLTQCRHIQCIFDNKFRYLHYKQCLYVSPVTIIVVNIFSTAQKLQI